MARIVRTYGLHGTYGRYRIANKKQTGTSHRAPSSNQLDRMLCLEFLAQIMNHIKMAYFRLAISLRRRTGALASDVCQITRCISVVIRFVCTAKVRLTSLKAYNNREAIDPEHREKGFKHSDP